MHIHGQELEINSDLVKWGEDYKAPDKTARYDYIGTIEGTDYYSYGYYTDEGMMRRLNRIGFMRVQNGKVLSESDDYIKLPYLSLVKAMTLKNELCILYEVKNKSDDSFEFRMKKIDKTTFKEQQDTILFRVDLKKKHKQKVLFMPSQTGNNYVALLTSTDKKYDLMTLTLFYYNAEMQEQWQTKYSSKQDFKITPLDVLASDCGKVYMISKKTDDETTEDSKMYYDYELGEAPCLLSIISPNDITEINLPETYPSLQANIFEIDTNRLYIAFSHRKRYASIEYNLESKTSKSFSSFNYAQSKGKTFWTVKKIIKSDNGNIVSLVCDDYEMEILNTASQERHFFNGRNFYILCHNPQTDTLYTKMISRAVHSSAFCDIDYGRYEGILFFGYKNNVYAIYNADRNYDDLSNVILLESSPTRTGSQIVANMIKINEMGQTTLTGLVPYKELGLMFSPAMSFRSDAKTIQINSLKGKHITFGELSLE
jgi:hypothetical protein